MEKNGKPKKIEDRHDNQTLNNKQQLPINKPKAKTKGKNVGSVPKLLVTVRPNLDLKLPSSPSTQHIDSLTQAQQHQHKQNTISVLSLSLSLKQWYQR